MVTFDSVELKNVVVDEYYNLPNKSIFTTIPWMNYLLEDNPGGEPIILRITEANVFQGYFTGMLIKKFGIRIVGSPFRGWSTCFMGLELIDGVDRSTVLPELKKYLVKKYHCSYIEIIDRQLKDDEIPANACLTKIQT